jgi:hypothetical protein
VKRWCEALSYTPVVFNALQTVEGKRMPIYHTNVMMSVGEGFALWCPSSIDDTIERDRVEQSLQKDKRELIAISEGQIQSFAGNILQVFNRKNEPYILMSAAAEAALRGPAIGALQRHGTILSSPIPTIERYGGGSVRCMVAEIPANR